MENKIELAKNHFFTNTGLSFAEVVDQLSHLSTSTIDYGDFYFHQGYAESWMIEEGIIKGGSYSVDQGVGIRANSQEKTGFAFSNELSIDAIQNAVKMVKAIATEGASRSMPLLKFQPVQSIYDNVNPLNTLSDEEKTAILHTIHREAKQKDPRVSKVIANISSSYEIVLIMATDGTLAADMRPMTRLNVSVIVESKGKREQGFCGGGGRFGYDFFSNECISRYVDEAVRIALVNLEAVDAPAGVMPVVLGAGWPAVLLHEAVGHGLEGDFNRKKSSIYTNRLGQKIANRCCTVIDDATIFGQRGSISVDDEGTPGQKTVLIENGILKNYMLDKLNARLLNMRSTGNARRQSFAHVPIPRMTNTYLDAGQHTPEAMIDTVKQGIYAPNFSGGQVDITSGKFVFSTSEAYLLNNGKIGKPIKGATLIGDGQTVLNQISMVGNDLTFDSGVGICGKEGQSVPVSVGQPTIKVDQLTIGGTV